MLYFSVDHQRLKLIRDDGVINESQDYLWAEFNFTTDWDTAIKVVQFYRGSIQFPEQHLEGNRCKVPWEALVDPAPFMVTVIGHNKPGEANLVITTNAQAVEIKKNGQLVGIDPAEPTKGVYGTKLAESLQAIDDHKTEVVGAVDAAGTAQKAVVEAAGTTATDSITSLAEEKNTLLSSTAQKGVEDIGTAKTTAVEAITAKQTAAETAIDQAKTTALQEVENSSKEAANSALAAQTSAGEAANSATSAASSATEATNQASSAASSANKAEQEAIRAANATDDKLDKKRFDTEQVAVPIIINALRQTGWAVENIKARLKEYEDIEYGTIALNNTMTYPFNDSKKTVALSRRRNKNYLVLTEIKSFNGNVGDIEITERLTNGFKIAYTGSAPSATIEYVVLGGV